MKNKISQFALCLVISMLGTQVFGQLYPVSLEQRIENATAIVSGKVVAQKSYTDRDDNIYTANLVEVSTVLKGGSENRIVIVTKGGQVDDRYTEWSHSLTLIPGQQGIFFLIPSTIEPSKERGYEYENMYTYAGQQGFIQIVTDHETKVITGRDPFSQYSDIGLQVLDKITLQTKETPLNLTGSATIRTGVRYHFANLKLTGNTVTFDIFVNSLIASKKLYQSGIVLGYNPLVFGYNLGSNGNLAVAQSGITSSSVYSLGLSNQTSSKVKISVEPAGGSNSFTTIDGSEKLLAKGALVFANPFFDPQITVDFSQLLPLNKWYDDQTNQSFPFDTVVVDADFRLLAKPIITFFTPDTVSAGTETMIEIHGLNFENYEANKSSVYFTYASTGPGELFSTLEGDIKFWDVDLIRVTVPTVGKIHPDSAITFSLFAGTGNIKVCNKSGLCDTSLTPLFVKFAVSDWCTFPGESPKEASFPNSLFGANDQKGFYISYGASFAADTAAVRSVERAMNTWKCTTGLNFTTDPAHPNMSATNTAVISYDSLDVGTLAETFRDEERCKDVASDQYIQGYLASFTLAFDTAHYTWYKNINPMGIVGTGKYDMQTLALHEFGHTHLLRHVNQIDHTMWWAYGDEEIHRTLQLYDIEGGNWVMDLSGVNLTGTNCPALSQPMFRADTTGLPCNILLSDNKVFLTGNLIKIYPNPANDFVTIEIERNNVVENLMFKVFDVSGKVWKQGEFLTDSETVPISELPRGLFFLSISDSRSIFTTKFIKL